mmetsp:Transcript_8750/g.21662  ORF Transcript_8750/g.21662 Transcript_8750/m.21662 type:complete len:237 (-) Transcript_8750:663-1373(-)
MLSRASWWRCCAQRSSPASPRLTSRTRCTSPCSRRRSVCGASTSSPRSCAPPRPPRSRRRWSPWRLLPERWRLGLSLPPSRRPRRGGRGGRPPRRCSSRPRSTVPTAPRRRAMAPTDARMSSRLCLLRPRRRRRSRQRSQRQTRASCPARSSRRSRKSSSSFRTRAPPRRRSARRSRRSATTPWRPRRPSRGACPRRRRTRRPRRWAASAHASTRCSRASTATLQRPTPKSATRSI